MRQELRQEEGRLPGNLTQILAFQTSIKHGDLAYDTKRSDTRAFFFLICFKARVFPKGPGLVCFLNADPAAFVNLGGYCAPCARAYTRIFDGVATVLRAEHPELQLHGLAIDWRGTMDRNFTWTKEFFSAANHATNAKPPEYASYHFCEFLRPATSQRVTRGEVWAGS